MMGGKSQRWKPFPWAYATEGTLAEVWGMPTSRGRRPPPPRMASSPQRAGRLRETLVDESHKYIDFIPTEHVSKNLYFPDEGPPSG